MTDGSGAELPRPRRLLTVCKGGHCRAPMAAAVLTEYGGAAVEVRSAALRNWHIGEGAHPTMVTAAADRGYDLTGHRGVQVSRALLDWANVVLAMDRAVLEALGELADEHTAPKLRLYLDGRDVPDPWERPAEAFMTCVTVIESGAGPHLVAK